MSVCLSVLSVNRGAVLEASPPKGHDGLERKLSSSLPTSPRMAIPQRSHNSASFPPSEELEQEVDSTQQKLRALLRRRRPSFVLDSPVKRDTMSSSCPTSAIATPKRTGSFGRLSELYSPTSSSALRLHPGAASDSALQTVQSQEHVSSETGQVSSDLPGLTESTWSREEGGLARRTTSVCSTGTLVASAGPMLGESETGLKPADLNQCEEGQPTHLSRSRVKMSPLEHLDLCLQSGADLHFFEETEWV